MRTLDPKDVFTKINKASTELESMNMCYEHELTLLEDVKYASENNMFDFIKKMSGYGTWTITAFVNEYYFLNYSDFLKKFRTVTHNEDYDISCLIDDIQKYIDENMYNFIQNQE